MTNAIETVVDLFARTASRHPHRPAVSDDESTVNYAELDARSDVLAHALLDRGIRRRDRVAIHRERGVDVFVAMLGILKIGAAYVAVDTRYPDGRRNLMIRGSGARLVITEPNRAPVLAGLGVDLMPWSSESPQEPVAPLDLPVTGMDMACVLFTSGSSGRPKAIMLEHRNLLYLAENASLPPLRRGDRFGQVSSMSFDAFHIETWCGFAHGAEVVVLPTMPELVATDLQVELRRRKITVMLAPTMAVNHVVHEDRDAFSALRVLYTGGDVLQPAASRALLSGHFRGEFYNLYGPTEAATACTSYPITVADMDCDSVPIGQALAGAWIHVLDSQWAEVAPDAVGQLCIGGAGVGGGYLGQPALTAERFVPDPMGAPGSRMYATGDLARRVGGVLLFCGRQDDQVKIRGYRVEPREAERAIVRHPGVRDAAVFIAGEGPDRRMVGLYVPHTPLSPRQLRAHLAQDLPDYLVPSLLVMVPEIPGNDHGKRDQDSLSRMAATHMRRQEHRIEPHDEIERYLCGMWEQLLGLEWLARDDDFFELGGNSMLAFRAHLRIQRDLGVHLDVAEIFEVSDLASVATLVRDRRTAAVQPVVAE